MAKKKRQKHTLPCFTFNQESLELTQAALKFTERVFEGMERRPLLPETTPERVALTRETLQSVKGKLEAMRVDIGMICLTAFDYNECVIILAAMTLYSNELIFTPASAQRASKLRQCHYIGKYMVDEIAKTGVAIRMSKTHD